MRMILPALLLLASEAHAFDFYEAPSYACANYCTGFATDSTDTVGYVDIMPYWGVIRSFTIEIDGVYYGGKNTTAPTLLMAESSTINDYTANVVVSDGNVSHTVTFNWREYHGPCIRSGRATSCPAFYDAISGSVQ